MCACLCVFVRVCTLQKKWNHKKNENTENIRRKHRKLTFTTTIFHFYLESLLCALWNYFRKVESCVARGPSAPYCQSSYRALLRCKNLYLFKMYLACARRMWEHDKKIILQACAYYFRRSQPYTSVIYFLFDESTCRRLIQLEKCGCVI